MVVSIIVAAHNASATLPACLEALQRQTRPPDEVIVVDDGSTDQTPSIAARYSAAVVRQPRQGLAAARNLGARQAAGDVLLFTDATCEPLPDWVERMCEPLADGCIAGAKGVYHTRQPSLVARFVQQEYESKYRFMAGQPIVDFVDTYSAAYRRSIFLDNGGFDTAFDTPSVEDQELSFRLARKGYRLAFASRAGVYHQHDTTLADYARRKYIIGYWKAFLLRWLPEKAFGDSHTPPSLRWQIACLWLFFGCVLAAPLAGAGALAAAAACLALFFVVAGPFLAQIGRRDRPVLPVAPVLLIGRAAGLGAGLLAGFILPPRRPAHAAGGLSLYTRPVKRLADIVVGAIGLVLACPAILAAAAAIKLESAGPALFIQERAGEGGKPFRVVKLRTMVDGADDQLPALLSANSVRGPTFKMPNDPRVTRVGRFLRRWSIDELPQFWNVLRGEMSLVGPRPEPLRFVAQYDDAQRRRLMMKPGLTGPAQVAGRGRLDFDDRLALELDYIDHYSLGRDFAILWRTLGAVVSGHGAY